VFRRLVSHNPDLAKLVDGRYAVAFDITNHLIVRDIPYLDERGDLQAGAFVAKLEFIDADVVRQTDHQIYFAGGVPHRLDGTPVPNLGGGATSLTLSESCRDVVVQRSFSNKPIKTGRYADFFDKIENYSNMISGPAEEKFGVSRFTRRVVVDDAEDPIFKFPDTLTSRAGITDLIGNLVKDTVAVIGLGGSGSYLLDFIVKTPVYAIRAFDHDAYCVHNAYRSPGRLDPAELGKSKAEVYLKRYENFRHRLTIERKFIDRSSDPDLEGVTFAFVCVDLGSARAAIFDLLIAKRVPFIDVGMGLSRKRTRLSGMIRTTYYAADSATRVREEGWAPLVDSEDDIYRDNVQIAELNALNASMAVIKFKQLRGFYVSDVPDHHLAFDITDLRVVSAGNDAR